MPYSISFAQKIRIAGFSAALIFLPALAAGQNAGSTDPDDAQIEYPPRFQIELVIFRQLHPEPGNEEFSPPYDQLAADSLDELDALLSVIDEPVDVPGPIEENVNEQANPPDAKENIDESGEETLNAEEPGAEGIEEPAPRRVPEIVSDEELWQFGDIIEHIDNSRDYQLLGHQVWQQDGSPPEEAEPFELQTRQNEAGVLDGRATLSLSRFLHLLLELNWLPAEKNEGLPLYPGLGGLMSHAIPYSINESRLMRGGKIHYFDHPYFGAIALITRVEEPAAIDEDGNPIVASDPVNNDSR